MVPQWFHERVCNGSCGGSIRLYDIAQFFESYLVMKVVLIFIHMYYNYKYQKHSIIVVIWLQGTEQVK